VWDRRFVDAHRLITHATAKSQTVAKQAQQGQPDPLAERDWAAEVVLLGPTCRQHRAKPSVSRTSDGRPLPRIQASRGSSFPGRFSRGYCWQRHLLCALLQPSSTATRSTTHCSVTGAPTRVCMRATARYATRWQPLRVFVQVSRIVRVVVRVAAGAAVTCRPETDLHG